MPITRRKKDIWGDEYWETEPTWAEIAASWRETRDSTPRVKKPGEDDLGPVGNFVWKTIKYTVYTIATLFLGLILYGCIGTWLGFLK